MNKEKYARLTVVLDVRTNRALRYVSEMTETGISTLVRELISEPVVAMADAISHVGAGKTDQEKQAAVDQFEMFVEGEYGKYLTGRSAKP